MKNWTFRTIIQRDGKFYHGFVPVLPGCHSQGATIEETRNNLREAISGYLKTLKSHKLPVPTDESLETIETVSFASANA